MKLPFFSLLKIITEGKSSYRFFLGAIFSFAFSISVVLSAIGLMDGFESTLVNSLRSSSGDIIVKSYDGVFFEDELPSSLKKSKSFNKSYILATQSFAVANEKSKGVLVHGVRAQEINKITGLDLNKIKEGEIALGKECAKSLGLKLGDSLALTFSTAKSQAQGIPVIEEFKVVQIVTHGIFEKDNRFVYVNRKDLAGILGYKNKAITTVYLKNKIKLTREEVEKEVDLFRERFKAKSYTFTPFWKEYATLIEAVEVEKLSITTILQLIVIVSIFNILAFVIFVLEKQSQAFFLLRALGLGQKILFRFWILVLVGIWFTSSIMAIFLAAIFDYLLQNIELFNLPGDIYVLSNLNLDLGISDYITVFTIALIWILLIGMYSIYRLKKKTLLFGLRQEFS